MDEQTYKRLTVEMFLSHSVYKLIRNEIVRKTIDLLPDDIKYNKEILGKYDACKRWDDFIVLFQDVYFKTYQKFITSFFTPYVTMGSSYIALKGLLGFVFFSNITYPAYFS
jgi:hypothetical protein